MVLLGEIRMFPFTPEGGVWMPCNGMTLRNTEHPALFSLIGFNYGGDGIENFALPNYFVDGGPTYYISVLGRLPDYNKLAVGLTSETNRANSNAPRP